MTLLQTQDINPLTGDVGLNPAAWGLSMKDINSAASVSLKSSIYAGNVNLTADQYREVESIIETKYSGVDYTGMIAGSNMISDISMLGRSPGLYMNQERLGYWKNDTDQWQAYIANNGNFAFKGDIDNYISWNGTTLEVRGDIEVADGSITAPKLATTILYAGEIILNTSGEIRSGQTAYNTGTGFWLGDDAGIKKFSIGNGAKGLTWDGSDLAIRGNIYAESGTFTGSITSSATITGGVLQSASSGKRIVIETNKFKSYDSYGVLRVETADEGMRISDHTGVSYADLSTRQFPGPGGPWPYLLISDTSVPSNRVGLRTSFLAGHPTSFDKSLRLYLDQGSITFRSIGGGGTSGTGVTITSPDDDTLSFDGKKISFSGVILEKIGTDLYWNGVKIN